MKQRVLIVAAFAALSAGLALLLWQLHAKKAALSLKILRQTVENGKRVAIFRIEGEGQRRFRITGINQIVDNTWQAPEWASASTVLNEPSKTRNEFGIVAPSNSFVWKETTWKLHVTLVFEQHIPRSKLLRVMMRIFLTRRPWREKIADARALWNIVLPGEQRSIESTLITNVVSDL